MSITFSTIILQVIYQIIPKAEVVKEKVDVKTRASKSPLLDPKAHALTGLKSTFFIVIIYKHEE